MIEIETILQYGIGGLAIYLMYRILSNDLKGIKELLVEAVEILKDIKKSVESN